MLLEWIKQALKNTKGWYTYDVHFEEGWGLASVLDVLVNLYFILFFLLLKKIGFAPWADIMLSQTLIYHWQEIFVLTLTLDSEAIL